VVIRTPEVCSLAVFREDVREIGSAVASVVLGEVRSDESVLADEVVVPTLQQLLKDAEDIDEVLLDQTMASLLATYNQVTRRCDRMVWQVIKVSHCCGMDIISQCIHCVWCTCTVFIYQDECCGPIHQSMHSLCVIYRDQGAVTAIIYFEQTVVVVMCCVRLCDVLCRTLLCCVV
jgi:hypothetical protein